jgi:hypothetical protein
MGMKIDAGTEALYEGDSAALAARNSTVTGTPPERRENRPDEDSNQGGQQRGVISDSITQSVGRRQHPLADRYVGNDAVYQVGCRIRHPSAPARRAYPSGLARERHDSVQLAGVASDPEETSGEHTAIEKRSKLLRDEARYMPLVILLRCEKRFQFTSHNLVE